MAEHGQAERYRQHILDRDEPCAPCREAERVKKASYRKRRYLNRGPLLVDATGTRRRIHALAAIGWSAGELATRYGYDRTAIGKWTQTPEVHVTTRDRVAALYEELWDIPGPSERVRQIAATRGWLPPLAWDDDAIDDPAAQPATVVAETTRTKDIDEIAVYRATHGDRVGLTTAERRAAVRILTDRGRTETQIADILGVAPRIVARDRSVA